MKLDQSYKVSAYPYFVEKLKSLGVNVSLEGLEHRQLEPLSYSQKLAAAIDAMASTIEIFVSEPSSLVLESKTFYRTQTDAKAYVAADVGDPPFAGCDEAHGRFKGWVEGEDRPISWGPDGRTATRSDDRHDLVARWDDPMEVVVWTILDNKTGRLRQMYQTEPACGPGQTAIRLTGTYTIE